MKKIGNALDFGSRCTDKILNPVRVFFSRVFFLRFTGFVIFLENKGKQQRCSYVRVITKAKVVWMSVCFFFMCICVQYIQRKTVVLDFRYNLIYVKTCVCVWALVCLSKCLCRRVYVITYVHSTILNKTDMLKTQPNKVAGSPEVL